VSKHARAVKTAAPPPGRSPAVDGLRTIAVVLVVVFHMFPTRLVGGAVGVDIFFVISGFVITTTLLQEDAATGRISLRAFYLRRWLRLMPALTLVGGTVLVAAMVFPTGLFAGQSQGAVFSMTYLMNLARGLGWGTEHSLDAMGHAWSLGIEEQFYLAWPMVLLVLLALPRRVAMVVWPLLIAVPTVLRITLWSPAAAFAIYNMPQTRFDELLVGACLAYSIAVIPVGSLLRIARPLFWPAAIFLGAVTASLPMGRTDHWTSPYFFTGGFLVLGVASTVVVARLALEPDSLPARVVGCRALSTFGRRYSYGTYLWHYVVLHAVSQYPLSRPAFVAIELAVLIPLVYLTYYLVERPALRIKRRHEMPRTVLSPRTDDTVLLPLRPGSEGTHAGQRMSAA
jgi:peptidoglycan/LPS O-acetylase OafA/YrhL